MELGAILEATHLQGKIPHTLCLVRLVRENEKEPTAALTPCGICQEGSHF